MKLQNLTVIFIIIIVPIILLMSLYISTGLKTLQYQALYDTGLLNATHDAIYAFEQNTSNDEFSGNPEIKRDILKSSVKMFEKSLANACNISSYNTDEIEEYIPAIVFGMYDGFYMYAPSYNSIKGKNEHRLKNYVYYSETIKGAGRNETDVIITYSLDNYITVSGDFGDVDGDNINDGYVVKKGFLINVDFSNATDEQYGELYLGIPISTEDLDGDGNSENSEARLYYENAFNFTHWFLTKTNIPSKASYLNIGSGNDPEDETSSFVQHKRKIMKEKIEGVLNSTITAYSERTWGQVYKMPKLSEDDWQKIYSNISMLTFFQGKSIGLTKYNGYCVANSTNSKEYVNPNLMYFTDGDGEYHDIRCSKCGTTLNGYRIGSFEKKKVEKTNDAGEVVYNAEGEVEYKYTYEHDELACYNCVNGSINTNNSTYEYVNPDNGKATQAIKTAYWTSLGRERYDPAKITSVDTVIHIEFNANANADELRDEGNLSKYNTPNEDRNSYSYGEAIEFPAEADRPEKIGHIFLGWTRTKEGENTVIESEEKAKVDTTYYAKWEAIKCDIKFYWNCPGTDVLNETPTIENQRYGDKINLLLKNDTRKPYTQEYEFLGWSKERKSDGLGTEGDILSFVEYAETVPENGIKFYGVWKEKTYKVIFHMNDGTSNKVTKEGIKSGTEIGTIISELFSENPTRPDYTFRGWSSSPSSYNEVENTEQIKDNKEYYAAWGYKVILDYNYTGEGGLVHKEEITVEPGDTFESDITGERGNYNFVGWSKDPSGSTGVSKTIIADANNVTYYAIWQKVQHEITYDYNYDSNGTIRIDTIDHGDSIPFPRITRTGYEFNGWNTDPNATSGITSATATKTTTYYAIWKKIQHEITYDYNYDSNGTIRIDTIDHGDSIPFPSITRTGYEFNGWNTDPNATSGITTATATEKTTYYAIWKAIIYKITCNHQLGVNGTREFYELYSVDYYSNSTATESIDRITIPTRSGYTFGGYYTQENGNGTQIVDKDGKIIVSSRTFTSGREIYAKWEDTTAPTITRAEYNSSRDEIIVQAYDNESGIVEYSVGSSKTTISSTVSITTSVSVTTSGTYTITVEDAAGNIAETKVGVLKTTPDINLKARFKITKERAMMYTMYIEVEYSIENIGFEKYKYKDKEITNITDTTTLSYDREVTWTLGYNSNIKGERVGTISLNDNIYFYVNDAQISKYINISGNIVAGYIGDNKFAIYNSNNKENSKQEVNQPALDTWSTWTGEINLKNENMLTLLP